MFFRVFVFAFFAVAPLAHADWPACGRVADYPGAQWRQADPQALGWNAGQLKQAQTLFRAQPSAAVMVVHQGRLVASWGTVGEKYTAQSVRKALLNSLAGIVVTEGRVKLTDTLEALRIDDRDPALTPSERQATFAQLLQSRSGIFHPALYEVGGWKKMRERLAQDKRTRGEMYRPGAYWVYNNWDFNTAGTIVERAARQGIGPMFAGRIARPLGMQDYRAEDVEYTTEDDVTEMMFGNASSHRAYVFNISTRDLARYGLMYLACGRWGGTQVISEAWVRESLTGRDTRAGRPADRLPTGFGDYGYLWQIDRPGARRFTGLKTREPYYIASGNRGHAMLVMPYLDLVIVHQVATVGGVGTLAQMWRAAFGSPNVEDEQFEALARAIIAAHPEGARAWE